MNDLLRLFGDDAAATVKLGEDLVRDFHLDRWADEFSLMTAGYRDRLDPDDPVNPEAPFNALTVAILAEAKARVFERALGAGDVGHVVVGGEVRPHTQLFIRIAARIYAAHGFHVHLRTPVATTPIWYSSFGIVARGFQSGDNFTASHSAFLKGGWKPLDGEGQQLLKEEAEIVREVKGIVARREAIALAPWDLRGLVQRDFDVDEEYAAYQSSVLGGVVASEIKEATGAGFRIAVCPVGGSMGATTARLFPRVGIATGPGGMVEYFLDEEDSQFHRLGHREGEVHGVDPCEADVYRNVGAQELLSRDDVNLVLVFDPDGDRLKVISRATPEVAARATALGVEVEDRGPHSIAYLSANQLYLALVGFRIELLKKEGRLEAFDWFVGMSFPTSKSIEELAASEGVPCARVPVGFKHIGDLCRSLEGQLGGDVEFRTVAGETVALGREPRALILCEESGGACFGGQDLLVGPKGSRQLALREKDGMQIALLSIALAAHLHNTGSSLAEYYCDLVESRPIEHLHYRRYDVRLYDETLLGDELRAAKEVGLARRDAVVSYFRGLAEGVGRGDRSLEDVGKALNSARPDTAYEFDTPKSAGWVGDGSMLEFPRGRFILRASGTDAVLRYYVEGARVEEVEALARALRELEPPRSSA